MSYLNTRCYPTSQGSHPLTPSKPGKLYSPGAGIKWGSNAVYQGHFPSLAPLAAGWQGWGKVAPAETSPGCGPTGRECSQETMGVGQGGGSLVAVPYLERLILPPASQAI